MQRPVRVAILDDHQSIVDGYLYRLAENPRLEVISTMAYGEELEPMLEGTPRPDVLILDVSVPTSPSNPNPYPILHSIPKLIQEYASLYILVISMFADKGLIRAVSEAGASGYILKDDHALIRDLASVVLSVSDGGICFSQRANQMLLHGDTVPAKQRLSTRQMEALSLSAAYPDQTTADLARRMAVSNSTVRNLLSTAYVRLGVRTRSAAIERARDLGLITPRPSVYTTPT